jgi:ribosomal protein S18 acetylase RimI-like enzyme
MVKMNNAVTVRVATINDYMDMAEIHMRSWEAAYKDILSAEYIREKNAKCPELWKNILTEMKYPQYIIQKDDKTVGILSIGLPIDDDLDDDYYELYGIYLHPDYYRQGIGTQVMEFVYSNARTLDKRYITLWVFAENTSSIRFYEKCGFAMDGKEQTRDFGKAMKCVRMRKDLLEG